MVKGSLPVVSLRVQVVSVGGDINEKIMAAKGKSRSQKTFYKLSVLFYRSDGLLIDFRSISYACKQSWHRTG